MQIHIAEEARHISWANEFLKTHMPERSWRFKAFATVAFPLTLRWLAHEIMGSSKSFGKQFDIPEDVMRQAFWRSPQSRKIMASFFDETRALAEEIGLMNRVGRWMWKRCGIAGETARYRSAPNREAQLIA
jgi:hypothetical protein